MACRYNYQGKTYEAHQFDDVLRSMAPSIAAKYMPSVTSVPDAPLISDTKSWASLVVKRALMMAAQEGHDGIVFATGQQNADLYDLSKSVGFVSLDKTYAGFVVTAYANDDATNEVLSKSVSTEAEVADIVGKDATDKLLKDMGKGTHGELRRADLKVGGEGMRAFYDQIVPSVTKDVLKKLGAGDVVVGKVEINQDGDASQGSAQQPGFLIPSTLASKVREGVPIFTLPRVIGDSGRPRTPEQEAMFKRIGRVVDEKTTLERLKEWISKRWQQGLFDQFAPFREMDMKAYILMRLSKGATGAFEAFMKHGKLFLRDGATDADTTGGVIEKVFVPLGKETTDFLTWIAGNRAERLAMEGKERLFTPTDIAAAKSLADGTLDFDYTLANGQTTRDRKDAYKDSLVKFNEFNKNIMDLAEKSGLIDGASRHLWEHEFYVPFYRVMEDEQMRGAGIKKGIVRQEAFKKLKGGEEKMGDLLANTLMNWAHLIDASAKNRAAKAALEAAETAGVARKAFPDEPKTVWFMDNGKQVKYKVTDPAVMEAIVGLEYSGMHNMVMNVLTAPKQWLTVGVTASPFFKVKNLIRDSVQAIATSDLDYNAPGNVIKGWKLTDRDSQEYVSALAGGGLIRFGTMLEGNEAARTRQLVKQMSKDPNVLAGESGMRRFYDKVVEPAWSAYQELGNRGEEINRMSLYDQLIKQGMDHATASLMARDLMDFSLQGSFNTIRFLAQVVPFFNARMQGMYKLGRASKENTAHMATVVFTTALMGLAMMAWAAGDDDRWKRWKKREEWDKSSYWMIEIGGMQFRIPRPFELGATAFLGERTVEMLFDSERDSGKRYAKSILDTVKNQLAMNPVPQAVKPIIDLYANKDSFTGRSIETMSMERLDPNQRYDANTSMPARWASKATGGVLSPVQYDHIVRGYFGWLGTTAVGSADIIARSMNNEPTRPSLDYWKMATGGLLQNDVLGSRYVSMVYDQAKELEQAHATFNRLRKEGKIEEAKEYMQDNKEKLQSYKQVEGVKKQLTTIQEKIRIIERSDKHPAEKRILIRELKERQSDIAAKLSQ